MAVTTPHPPTHLEPPVRRELPGANEAGAALDLEEELQLQNPMTAYPTPSQYCIFRQWGRRDADRYFIFGQDDHRPCYPSSLIDLRDPPFLAPAAMTLDMTLGAPRTAHST